MNGLKASLTSFILVVLVLITSASCSSAGNEVKINVIDNGTAVSIDARDNMTVEEMLSSAQIKVDSRDDVVPDLKTVWSQANADSITIKRFAGVTVTDGTEIRNVGLFGGTVEQAITQAGFNIGEYEASQDLKSYVTDGMTINLTYKPTATTAAPTTEKASEAVNSANSIIGDEENGYYYTGSNGEVDYNYSDGVTVNGEDWIVICGSARRVVTESDKTLYLACKDVAKWTNSSMTGEEKLKVCFDSIKSDYLEGVRHNPAYREDDWPVVCANDIFVYGKGDCYSFGSAFAYIGRAIGYTESYAVNSGGHGWAEINGLIYDPEWSMHSQKSTYCGISYDDNVDVPYASAIADGAEWKRKKIE